MKKIIICEKPSLARFVASCLSGRERFVTKSYKNSDRIRYYESDNYIVAAAHGHLFTAYDIGDYTKDDDEWKLDILPFCPPDNKFLFKLRQIRNKETGKMETDKEYRLLYESIYALLNREDVNGIIHCGDAAREGEIIVRQIVLNANKSNKPMVRLWLNAMAQEAFNEAFSNMQDDSAYDNYAREGMTRLKSDYLYGINLTRYLSLKGGAPKGKPFHAGRVKCGMLREIYDREMEIENFVPQKYYALVSKELTMDTEISLRVKEKFNMDEYESAVEMCGYLNQSGAQVTELETQRKKVGAGRLFSLISLQNWLSTKNKMSLAESMKYIQSVYEKGFITYPRTNTEYLPEEEKVTASGLIDMFNKAGYDLELKNSKKVFDSSKVEDHGALCPTKKIPQEKDLSANERIVYETVRNRFLAVFCKEDCLVDKSTMKIACGNETFTISGSILVQKGYLKYEEHERTDTLLPPLNKGDSVNVNFCPVEEETKPPARYTEATFNDFLENPFSKEKQTEEEKYELLMKGIEIGTVASRTSIISTLLSDHYMELKKGTYYLMPAGRYLIELMEKLGIDMTKEKTVETSALLRKVFNGELTENEVIEMVKADLEEMMKMRDLDVSTCVDEGVVTEKGFSGDPIGECPICGGGIYETKSGYMCENASFEEDSACRFYLKKDGANAYFKKVTGSDFKSTTLAAMLKYGYVPVKTKSKKQVEYETLIRFKIRDDGSIGFEINPVIGKCPICGDNVKATPFGYKCDREDCYYILFRNDKFIMSYQHKPLSIKQAMSVISKGSMTLTLEKKDKSGKYKMKFIQNIDRIEKKMSWTSQYVQKRS